MFQMHAGEQKIYQWYHLVMIQIQNAILRLYLRTQYFQKSPEDSRITHAPASPRWIPIRPKLSLDITALGKYSISFRETSYGFEFKPKVTRNYLKIRSLHLGTWAVWRPPASWRRVLRTMYWFNHIWWASKMSLMARERARNDPDADSEIIMNMSLLAPSFYIKHCMLTPNRMDVAL